MSKRNSLSCLVVAASSGIAGLAQAQVVFTPLGDLPGGSPASWAAAVSRDGRTVVGRSSGTVASVVNEHTFRWTPEEGMVAPVMPVGWRNNSQAVGASQDGTVIAGTAFASTIAYQPYIWTPAGISVLGGLLGATSNGRAYQLSANGQYIVGESSANNHPTQTFATVGVRWTIGGGPLGLGWLPGSTSCTATTVSADGATVLGVCFGGGGPGSDYGQIFKWTKATGIQPLDAVPEGTIGWHPTAISDDGSIVCAEAVVLVPNQGTRSKLVRWTSTGGAAILDVFPQFTQVNLGAMSPDGRVVVGAALAPPAYRAIVWATETGGLRLDDYLLTRHGFQLPTGWALERATGISADRRTIVGQGVNPSGNKEGWKVTLPWPIGCYANCDESAGAPLLTANDFTCFINAYATGQPRANCDNSTGTPMLTPNDFACFVNSFALGCP